MPPGARGHGPAVEPGETLDAISGHFRIFQLENGHRFSTDDVLTAWYGTSWCPSARTVLDLGSGAGIDVFLAAKAVGPTGKAIGLDMTDEMLKRARANKAKLGVTNAEFWKGEIEDMPIESNSVDRIISNCVINLVPDKQKAFSEIYRVLKPGGRFIISDIVSIGDIPAETRRDLELWSGCVAGATEKEDYLRIVREAGFRDLRIEKEKPYSLEQTVPFGLASITLAATK